MNIEQMQLEVDSWIRSDGKGYWEPLSMMARLTEETGEMARILNHAYGGKKKKPTETHSSIEGELGDLLFTIICMANAFDVDLEQAYSKTVKKSRVRDKHRFK